METSHDRMTYLDNLRVVLVYLVVFFHIICMFSHPITFYWPSIDKNASSGFYEILMIVLDIFLMPHLLFLSAVFIFYSLKNKTTLNYLKKRFFRLVIPILVFTFCAGDIHFQLLFKRLTMAQPDYLSTFLAYWRDFPDFRAISIMAEGKALSQVFFNMMHTWFLSFLFAMTLIVVLVSGLFRKKETIHRDVDSKKKIILKTSLLSIILAFVFTAIAIVISVKGIRFQSFIRVLGLVQFRIDQFFVLTPLFLLGLYMYKKDWLTKGDLGSWKMWGILSAALLLVYVLIVKTMFLSELNGIYLFFAEASMLSNQTAPAPDVSDSFKLAATMMYFLTLPLCLCLLMFFLSFTRTCVNRPNTVTAFCSKHSINVFLLHFIPVLMLQHAFMDMPVIPVVRILLMLVIIIPACLWLSYRFVSPYPGPAIAFFVILKLVALFAGFEFYAIALYALIALSFAGALIEFSRQLMGEKALMQSA